MPQEYHRSGEFADNSVVGPFGLLLFWSGVTFSHDVAPVLYRECVSCHRPGGVAPFSLVDYRDAAKRATLIAAVTAKHAMPPWLPSEPHFQNERRLSDSEIATIARGGGGGAPGGHPGGAPT